jgi:hypothetical protein
MAKVWGASRLLRHTGVRALAAPSKADVGGSDRAQFSSLRGGPARAMEHFGEYYLVTSSTRRGAGNDHEEVDVEGEHAPSSWVGQRVRLVTIQEADRTSHEEALLLYLDQLGITIR